MPNYAKLAVDSALSAFGIRSHYEQPRYKVVEYVGSVEIRAYGRRLAAEATVTAPDEEAGREQAFKILAAYIFGRNRTADGGASDDGTGPSAAATGPAEAKADSTGPPREIAMTTPVETRTTGAGRFAMRLPCASSCRANSP
jgi:SOUL heme-binding protein